MVWGPILGVDAVLCPLKDRVSNTGVPQVQRFAKIGGGISVSTAKEGIRQQQPITFKVVNDGGGLWQLFKPHMQTFR